MYDKYGVRRTQLTRPPRKRAKTEDEKEQRRVERVLRNRRAAQSSRERKRQEVEALEAQKNAIERRNLDLEMRLADLEAKNLMLQRELEQFTGNANMAVFRGSSAAASPSPRPVTFSQDLFAPRDNAEAPTMTSQVSPLDSQPTRTVNPASLSPEIRPVATSSNASSSDLTQHPAAVLCDLQCQSQEQRPWTSPATTPAISQLLAMTMFISTTSSAISALLTPLSLIITSLRTGSSVPPTTSILTMIMWLSTTKTPLTVSTSASSSTTTSNSSSRPRFSLRVSLLNRLLACSPDLARPLMDATTEAMRLASEQQLTPGSIAGASLCDRRRDSDSPSLESLMTLLWATRVFEKNHRHRVPELDTATTEAARSGGELGDLLRAREVAGKEGVIFRSAEAGRQFGQKSLDDWCLAFKQGRP